MRGYLGRGLRRHHQTVADRRDPHYYRDRPEKPARGWRAALENRLYVFSAQPLIYRFRSPCSSSGTSPRVMQTDVNAVFITDHRHMLPLCGLQRRSVIATSGAAWGRLLNALFGYRVHYRRA